MQDRKGRLDPCQVIPGKNTQSKTALGGGFLPSRNNLVMG
jgi:hypothetical protein